MDIVSAGISQLNFKEIAEKWAKEDATSPAGLSEKDTFWRLVESYLRGQFEAFELTIPHAAKDKLRVVPLEHCGTLWTRVPAGLQPMNRERFVLAMRLAPGCGLSIPSKKVLRKAKRKGVDAVPWNDLASAGPDAFDRITVERILEKLTIKKEYFGQWCDARGFQRPAFWFGDLSTVRSEEPVTSTPLRIEEDPPTSPTEATTGREEQKVGTKNVDQAIFEAACDVYIDLAAGGKKVLKKVIVARLAEMKDSPWSDLDSETIQRRFTLDVVQKTVK